MTETQRNGHNARVLWDGGKTEPSVSFDVPGRFREAVRRAERVFSDEGFELTWRVDLAQLARNRAGIAVTASELLFFLDPLLMLQTLLARADASLLCPLVVRITEDEHSVRVCVCGAWPGTGHGVVSDFLAEQARARFQAAVRRLRAAAASA